MENNPESHTQTLFKEKMQALREAYEKSIPARIQRVKDIWISLKSMPRIVPDLVQVLRDEVHKLVGSGATYGFAALSSIMQRLEHKLEQLLENPDEAPRILVEADAIIRCMETVGTSSRTFVRSGHSQTLIGQKLPRPELPKLLFVCEPGSPLRRLPDQVRHFGWDVLPCDYAQALERFGVYRPDIVVFHETPEQPCPAPGEFKCDPAPVVFSLHSNPDLCSRAAAYRKGIREVLSLSIEVAELVDRLDGCFLRMADTAYRVLIVDDDDETAVYHRDVLEQAGMEVRLGKSSVEVQEVLAEFKPDVILMDLQLSEYNGIELSAAIRQDQSLKQIPIIFASVAQDLDTHIRAIRAGGDDFLFKPIAAPFLVASLESRARRGRELRELLHFDGLTGLLNHRTTEELMQQAVARADRTDGELVVVMIDLDHFKQVNDHHGHVTGDRVLVNFARFLKGRLRKSDIVGRYGGEEFMLVLIDTSIATARAVVESLRESFAVVNHNSGDVPLNVTFSAGLAVYPTFRHAIDLTHAADTALYLAKHNGRNCSVIAMPEMLKDNPVYG
jgi:diguanylate cyclase (GGDEF)-like protein